MQDNKKIASKTSLPWYNGDDVDAPFDDIPELTLEMLERANIYVDGKLVRRRGRPIVRKENTLKHP